MNELTTVSDQDEKIAQLMLEHKGNLNLVSRDPSVMENVMALRTRVSSNPNIRTRYQELLSYELQESGLHISERILKMTKLQDACFGDIENDIPADPKMAIELSKHISDLMKEARILNLTQDGANTLVSKESAEDILKAFLTS